MSSAQPPTDDPKFDLYADERGRIIGTMVVIYILTIASVALRFLSRKLSRAGFWWDDYLCLVALVVSLMAPSICLYELRLGYGRHIYIFSPADRVEKAAAWLKCLYVFELLLHTATTLSKLAMWVPSQWEAQMLTKILTSLAFYHRILPVPRFQHLLKWIAGLCVLYMIGVDLAIIFQCKPIHHAWDQVRPGSKGHCFDEDAFFIGSGSVNAFLNLLVFVLPMPLLRRLRTTVRQQMILTAIFTLAGFVVLVSVVWIIVLSRLHHTDITWNYVDTGIWSALEPNMAVVCACIPSLRPLFSVARRNFSQAPLARSPSRTDAKSPLKRIWDGDTRQSNSDFSKLEELDDLRPLGHDVLVRGGKGNTGQSDQDVEQLPQTGINVKTEVTLSTSDRLDYNDRLF